MSQGFGCKKVMPNALSILVSVGFMAVLASSVGAEPPIKLAQLVGEAENIGIDTESDTGKFMRSTPRERAAARSREVKEIRIAQQFGLGYLPLMTARQYGLIEKHATRAGLGNLRVIWSRFPSGKVMNDALQTGLLDVASGGVAPLVKMWDKHQGASKVLGIGALCSMPQYLNSINPAVRSLRDLSSRDRIAMPDRRVSGQAMILRMASAQTFGDHQTARFDEITVSMSHPDGMQAMLDGKAGITAHFTSPPFQYQELEDDRVRTVTSSYTVLGGMSTFNLVWTRENFFTDNPRTLQAVYDALLEAMAMIQRQPRTAAKDYVLQSDSPLSVDFVERVIRNPQIEFTHVPKNVVKLAEFMYRDGAIENQVSNWQELFLPTVYGEDGS